MCHPPHPPTPTPWRPLTPSTCKTNARRPRKSALVQIWGNVGKSVEQKRGGGVVCQGAIREVCAIERKGSWIKSLAHPVKNETIVKIESQDNSTPPRSAAAAWFGFAPTSSSERSRSSSRSLSPPRLPQKHGEPPQSCSRFLDNK